MTNYRVIVLGVDHHNALGLVHSLSRVGIKCEAILVGPVVDGYVLKSKFVSRGYRCADANEAINYLLENYNKNVVVLTASDDVAVALDDVYNRLPSTIRVPNAKGHLHYWINKQSMCALAETVGLYVPKHFVYRSGDLLPDDVPIPCITKSISSVDGTKANTHICQSREQVETVLASDRSCRTFIIEQFIEKEFEFQFIGLSLNEGEIILIPGHSHIDWPEIENTIYFPYLENDYSFRDTLEKTKQFIKKTAYSGLFSVEFLRGKDGRDYFLEMNFRNDGNAICATDAGYNLPYIWFLYCSGGDYIGAIKACQFQEVSYCPEFVCTYKWLSGRITVSEWWRMVRLSDSYTVYCPGDNGPFWCNLLGNIRGFASTYFKRLFHIG